jgi:hypothetical protein
VTVLTDRERELAQYLLAHGLGVVDVASVLRRRRWILAAKYERATLRR